MGETRLKAIDGLRAVACLMVISHHCVVHAGLYDWPVIGQGAWALHIAGLLSLGYIGVEFFFVISGFCLAYPILRSPLGRIDIKNYAVRRALRILPPYYVAFILFGVAVSYGHPPEKFRYWLYGIFLVGTIFNASFWTLVVEARWYLVLPLLLRVLRQYGFMRMFSATIAVSLAFRILSDGGCQFWPKVELITSRLPLYLPTFALGIGVAYFYIRGLNEQQTKFLNQWGRWLGIIPFGAVLLLVPAFVPQVPTGDYFSYARIVPASLAGFYLIVLALYDPVVTRLLGSPALSFIGTASYSIYLIHEPIVRYVYSQVAEFQLTSAMLFVVFQFGVLPLCVVVGIAFYWVVERPFLRLIKRVPSRPKA